MATINLDKIPASQQPVVTMALQELANNLTYENILFLGSLAKKPNINTTLDKNKNLISKYL